MLTKKKRLGEIVLRSEDPQRLVDFYRRVIGLEVYASIGSATFLKIEDDLQGHPQLLAIFDKKHEYSGPMQVQVNKASSESGTLHHFAFAMTLSDFLEERLHLQKMGIETEVGEHPAFGWRSIYLYDPDGNSVELVCYDPSFFDLALNRHVKPISA